VFVKNYILDLIAQLKYVQINVVVMVNVLMQNVNVMNLFLEMIVPNNHVKMNVVKEDLALKE
jgi:hypothetical protein